MFICIKKQIVEKVIKAKAINLCLFFLISFAIQAQQLDKVALERLVAKSKETNSMGLTVYLNGKLEYSKCFDTICPPSSTASFAKSVASLAIGLLITQKKLDSVNVPVYRFYPEWNQGQKKFITIKHLLNHTSGIEAMRGPRDVEASNNCIQFALASELSDKPGTKFYYNNEACNILAGIVQKASGMRMDEYIQKFIFNKIGISDYIWYTDYYRQCRIEKNDTLNFSNVNKDCLKMGNPYVMGGLAIKSEDMAKIGLFMLNKGKWNNEQIINESWINECLAPSQSFNKEYGYLWWLVYDTEKSYTEFGDEQINKLKSLNLPDSLINELKTIKRRYMNSGDLNEAIEALPYIKRIGGRMELTRVLYLDKQYFDPIGKLVIEEGARIIGYAGKGDGGNYLYVFPEKKLVVARKAAPRRARSYDQFFDIETMIYNLVK
jgi:CubicO group peptidase (beta-lactamase class C family)